MLVQRSIDSRIRGKERKASAGMNRKSVHEKSERHVRQLLPKSPGHDGSRISHLELFNCSLENTDLVFVVFLSLLTLVQSLAGGIPVLVVEVLGVLGVLGRLAVVNGCGDSYNVGSGRPVVLNLNDALLSGSETRFRVRGSHGNGSDR